MFRGRESGGNLHIDAAQGLVDCSGLHIRHGRQLHLLRNRVDEVGVNESTCSQFRKLCGRAVLADALGCLCGRGILPLCAVVEASKRGIRETGRLQWYP